MSNWQDVMIEHHGKGWAIGLYEKYDVFKMAELVDKLTKERDDLKAAVDAAFRNEYSDDLLGCDECPVGYGNKLCVNSANDNCTELILKNVLAKYKDK